MFSELHDHLPCEIIPTEKDIQTINITSIKGKVIIEKLDTIKLIFLSFIYILSSCCHLSNGLIAASAIVLLLLIKILFMKKSSILHFKRLMLLLFLSFSSYLTVIAINYSHDNGISYSKGSHVFLMAHVLTSGTMTDFLKENCDKVEYKNCKICNYKDSLETNLEYRFHVFKSIYGAWFIDAGNIWLSYNDPSKPNGQFKLDQFYKDIAIGSGFGLRYDFSFFVLRLDAAMRVHDPKFSQGNKWVLGKQTIREAGILNFGIGYPF